MNKEFISQRIILFNNLCHEENNIEYWYARDIMEPLGYKQYIKFQDAIERAKESCIASNHPINAHFINVQRPVDIGSGAVRVIDDIMLTRYAAYLIALNGDPRKPEIAFAQQYFIQQTRKVEIIEKSIVCNDRIIARNNLKESDKELCKVLSAHGVSDKGYGRIKSEGDKALFGGYTTKDMKEKYDIPEKRALGDFLQKVVLVGKEFANELTSTNVISNNINGEKDITAEHVDNNLTVREAMLNRGICPENLPPSEDIRVLENRVNKEKRELLGSMLNEIEEK